jgi:hypothetical protein
MHIKELIGSSYDILTFSLSEELSPEVSIDSWLPALFDVPITRKVPT